MSFGGWAISEDLYEWLVEHVPEGKTILELGSGDGTAELVKRWTVWSVEHDEEWASEAPSKVIHAPLINGWYDRLPLEKVRQGLIDYDCLIVDGPPQNLGRGNFVKNMDLFNPAVPWVFDDIQKWSTLKWVAKVASLRGTHVHEHKCRDGKSFGVIWPTT